MEKNQDGNNMQSMKNEVEDVMNLRLFQGEDGVNN